ncbi:type II toxin-antitoxin system ParD family antitoxin [Aquibium sp. ELW1220]|uniref:ribbon-helix-helix domain-containing protein n=1 Tax=Aquibium sp. ELW1220 TaxID=2976766 RepID=UPI0025B12EA2|nr:type II toxin-antitoxin system ParD family antitoxin [Aquibium sp. ELW1220]MDN2580581.1 type II toxin-antitoxin system ParD family antitoxin [Aquibium sp. ELW1220]
MGRPDVFKLTLPEELAAEVDGVIAAGEYGSADEIVGEALRDWKERRDNDGYSLAELRRLVQDGIDSGPGIDGRAFMERLLNDTGRAR